METTYVSRTDKRFFFTVLNDETPGEYFEEFISPNWKQSAIDQYNQYAKENNLKEVEVSEVENMNTFDSIIYLMNKIPDAPSYDFVASSSFEVDLMTNQGIFMINIKTDYEFEMFVETIGTYWDAE